MEIDSDRKELIKQIRLKSEILVFYVWFDYEYNNIEMLSILAKILELMKTF